MRVIVDRTTGRSFNASLADGDARVTFEFLRRKILKENGVEAELYFADAETSERVGGGRGGGFDGANARVLPSRYVVGDKVFVAIDGRCKIPPYDRGWTAGVVAKVQPRTRDLDFSGLPIDPRMIPDVVSYSVIRDDTKREVPVLHDTPDDIRGIDAKYQPGAPLRFKVGDEVECAMSPTEWVRGTVRETWQPFPAWGRGWTDDGRDLRDGREKDRVPYLVTRHGATDLRGKGNIMVPADNEGYIRSFKP